MYSLLEDYRTEKKKVNGLIKNVPARISQSEYKDVLVNKKIFETLDKQNPE